MASSEADLHFLASLSLISTTTIEGVLYGVIFTVYISCARLLYPQLRDRDHRRQNIFTLLYTSLLVTLLLFVLAVDSRQTQVSYVEHADYPDGGGYGYSIEVFEQSSLVIVEQVVFLLMEIMLGGIQIWRLWVVFSNSRYSRIVLVIPGLSLLVFSGFMIGDIVVEASGTVDLATLFLYGTIVPVFCLSISVTCPIVIYILMFNRRNKRIMGESADITNPYISVISIIIESFALETVWILFQVLFVSIKSTSVLAVSDFFGVTLSYIQVLAYFLVVYRVATGRGWREDTGERLTTLQWNQSGPQTTESSTQMSIPIAHDKP